MIQNADPLIDILLNMGYKEELISLAVDEAETGSLEEIVELLNHRKRYYKDILMKRKEEELRQILRQSLGTKQPASSFVKPSKNNFSTSESEGLLKKALERKVVDGPPQPMTEVLTRQIKTIVKSLAAAQHADPNLIMLELEEHLESLRLNFKQLESFLFSSSALPSIIKLKNIIYVTFTRILSTKLPFGFKFEFKKFEELVSEAVEMGLVGASQKNSIYSEYNSFKKKLKVLEDLYLPKKVEKKMKKIILEFDNKENENPNRKMMNLEENTQTYTDLADVHCIICMRHIRGVVLLPCCHFLTCSSCSPKLSKCPMCSKEIEKHLNIYWC